MFNDYYKKFRLLKTHKTSKKRLTDAKAAVFARIGEAVPKAADKSSVDMFRQNGEPQTVSVGKRSPLRSIIPIAAAAAVTAAAIPVGVNIYGRLAANTSTSGASSAHSADTNAVSINLAAGYTDTELAEIINSYGNLTAAEHMYVNVPESAKVYKFKTYNRPPENHSDYPNYRPEDKIADFKKLCSYIYPDKEFDENCFKYKLYVYIGDPHMQNDITEGYLKDLKELPKEGILELSYSERGVVEYSEQTQPIEIYGDPTNVGALTYGGKTTYLIGKLLDPDGNASSKVEDPLHLDEVERYLPLVGRYSPESKRSFKLLDKEVRICDAVKYFEDFTDNMPLPDHIERNTRTKVFAVDVLQIDENSYGYYFEAQNGYSDVNFDYMKIGDMEELNFKAYFSPVFNDAYAFMLESDKLDMICNAPLTKDIEDMEPCENVLSIEDAIRIYSEKLKKYMNFEVESVEFVYAPRTSDPTGMTWDFENYEMINEPAWKMVVYDPNDDRTYFHYIDAVDGGNLRYYSVPGKYSYD